MYQPYNPPPWKLVEKAYHLLYKIIKKGKKTCPQDPRYASVLLRIDRKKDLSEGVKIVDRLKIDNNKRGIWAADDVWAARNTVASEENHLKHAEIKVLETASKKLYQAVYGTGNPNGDELPLDRRPNFFIFVNTVSCPMCMTAIIKSHVLNIFYFGDAKTVGKPPGPLPIEMANQVNAVYGAPFFRVEQVGTPMQRKVLEKQRNDKQAKDREDREKEWK